MAIVPHPRQIQTAVVDWLDDRFPFTKTVDEALYQRVPNYANAFYYCFGGMVFILIVFQLVTGVFLSFYYVPDASGNPAAAYTSVQDIMSKAYLGWLIRGVHFWSANLLIIMVTLHIPAGDRRAADVRSLPADQAAWNLGAFVRLAMKLKAPTPDVPVTRWDGELREGPGAATAAIPIIQVDGHGGHTLEPGYKRMPIGP